MSGTPITSPSDQQSSEGSDPSLQSPLQPSEESRSSFSPSQSDTQSAPATMSFQPLNPRPFLQARVGTEVLIRLKWGQTEYKGILESVDSYMNALLRDTEEFIDGKSTGVLGLVLIRCNNILWIGSADSVEMTDMELK
ncbi:unnamed protein product [Penicillium olsonii]|nr:unnamed protein product [Penicillium olsonii]